VPLLFSKPGKRDWNRLAVSTDRLRSVRYALPCLLNANAAVPPTFRISEARSLKAVSASCLRSLVTFIRADVLLCSSSVKACCVRLLVFQHRFTRQATEPKEALP